MRLALILLAASLFAAEAPTRPVPDRLQFEAQRLVSEILTLEIQKAKLTDALKAKQLEMAAACGEQYELQYDQGAREWKCAEKKKQ
jgi:hypothetical protein